MKVKQEKGKKVSVFFVILVLIVFLAIGILNTVGQSHARAAMESEEIRQEALLRKEQ